MTKKPYEMNFAEFAEAIVPKQGWRVTTPLERTQGSADWLTNVWRSTDSRITYSVNWENDALKIELPPVARRHEFEDLLLFPIMEGFGLNIESIDDRHKTAELLATCKAWITSIQNRYGQSNEVGACFELSLSAAAEYVLLTSDWMQHPWIQRQIRQHIEVESLKKLELASKPALPVEMSSNPLWPGTQVIHAKVYEPSAQELARHEEEMKDIHYCLKKFKSEKGKWTSEFDIYAYEAECDINIARLKIAELKKIIEKQEALIFECNRIIKKNKRLEAAIIPSNRIGRPYISSERQEVALRFVSQWVQSLIDELQVKNCAQLETCIPESNQRNWRRWLGGDAVPTSNNLTDLLSAEVRQGRYKGQPLHNVPTTPEHNDLLSLISLI